MREFDSFFDYFNIEQNHPFLFDFTDEDWSVFLRYATPEVCEPGMIVAEYDERDRSLYIVRDGEFEVFVPTKGNGRKSVAKIAQGSVFGELGFFDGEPRLATVIATKRSTLLKLSQMEFERMCAQAPAQARQLLMELGRLMAKRFRSLNAMMK